MTPVDLNSQELWDEYTTYKKRMFSDTDTDANPWKIIKTNRKTTARLEAIEYILDNIPYEKPPNE